MHKFFKLFFILLSVQFAAYTQPNVGIGTTTPSAKLHVRGNLTGTQIIVEETSTAAMLRMSAEPNNTGPYIGTTSNHRFSLVANNQPVIYLTTAGNVGIGLDAPQQRLGIRGGIVVDQDNQNTGTTANSIRFGNQGGEAIGSKRNAGSNQNGLDFYTGNTLRMTVGNNGNIGIGTNNPQGLLEIKTGNDRSIKFKHEVVPTMELVSSNSNDALAGIMRFRNSIEVMPNAAGTKAGKIDVRNIGGNATISLDGSNGVITAANAAAFGFKKNFKQVIRQASGNYNESLCEITVNVPASGILFIEAVTDCAFRWNQLWNTYGLELKLDEYSNDDNYIGTLTKQEYRNLSDFADPVIFASLVVPTAGIRKIKFILFKSGNTHSIGGENHAIKVWYCPTALQVN